MPYNTIVNHKSKSEVRNVRLTVTILMKVVHKFDRKSGKACASLVEWQSAVSINTASVSINTAIECAQFSVSICIQLIEAREGGEEIGRMN